MMRRSTGRPPMRCSLTISGTSSTLEPAVPNGFGVDDDGGAMLALLKASGLVDADAGDETGGFCGVFEGGVELALAVGSAGGARAARLADIGTDEDVALEFRQSGLLRMRVLLLWYLRFPPAGMA